MTSEFRLGTRVVLGRGSVVSLRAYAEDRVLVITDDFLSQSRLMQYVQEQLHSEVALFTGVVPDPGTAVVKAGLQAYIEARPDLVIALGGGSVMDAAKVIHKTAQAHGYGGKHGLIAIPTTSGSGSEVTSVAVITDEEHQTKIPVTAPDLAADVAILDPVMVDDLPPSITADSGLDVVTHAVEAYVATGANDFTDALVEKAIEICFLHLPACLAGGRQSMSQEHMHNASGLAALAFENAGLGITHSLSHAVGGHFPISHGRLNAMLLPHVIDFNAERDARAAERYAILGRRLAPAAQGAAGLVELRSRVEKLIEICGLPTQIAAAKVAVEGFRRVVPEMAETALADACTSTNPVRPTEADLRVLLHKLA